MVVPQLVRDGGRQPCIHTPSSHRLLAPPRLLLTCLIIAPPRLHACRSYAPGFPEVTTSKALCVQGLDKFATVTLNVQGCKVQLLPLSDFKSVVKTGADGSQLRGRLLKSTAVSFESDCGSDNNGAACAITVHNKFAGEPDPSDRLHEEWTVYQTLCGHPPSASRLRRLLLCLRS